MADHTRVTWMPTSFEARNAPRWHGTSYYKQRIRALRTYKEYVSHNIVERPLSLTEVRKRGMYGY